MFTKPQFMERGRPLATQTVKPAPAKLHDAFQRRETTALASKFNTLS
jgi:hypothetical protein